MKESMKEWRTFERVLKDNGYILKRSKGSHVVYTDGEHDIVMNRNINRMLAKRLIKENNLDAGEYLRRYEEFVLQIAQELIDLINYKKGCMIYGEEN